MLPGLVLKCNRPSLGEGRILHALNYLSPATNGHNTAAGTAGGERHQKSSRLNPPRINPIHTASTHGDRTGTLGSVNGEGLGVGMLYSSHTTHTHPWYGCYGREGHVRLPIVCPRPYSSSLKTSRMIETTASKKNDPTHAQARPRLQARRLNDR